MKQILITGANRGIGLELCRQYVDQGLKVIATCRQSTNNLKDTGARVIENVDVTSDASVRNLAETLANTPLDLILNNAGLLTKESLDDLDIDRIRRQFEVNTLGPLRIVNALKPNLSTGSRIGIITSRVGSIEDNSSGGIYGYRISKAAANMVGKNLSNDFKDRGIPVIMLHPGLVATEMTGGNGIQPSDAAAGLIQQIERLNMQSTGTFWHAEGYQLPW